jgi:hypothetical protein
MNWRNRKVVLLTLFSALLFPLSELSAQSIGRKIARMELLSYNPLKDDGELMLEMDVRMADCVSHLEITSANSKKPLVVNVTEEDYYLSEDGKEQIFLKVSLGNMKEILKKNKEIPAGLTVFSKSGKPIYSKQHHLVKDELIASVSRN